MRVRERQRRGIALRGTDERMTTAASTGRRGKGCESDDDRGVEGKSEVRRNKREDLG